MYHPSLLTSLQEMGMGHMGFTLPIGLTSGPVKRIRVVGSPHNVDMWVLCANLKHTFGDEKGQCSSNLAMKHGPISRLKQWTPC